MAESKNIGFRIPADLLAEINARVGGDFRNRTELIIWLLGKGLAIAPTDTPTAPGLDLETRVRALEKEVQTLDTAIQRLTETPNTAIQCHTETPNTAIQRLTETPNTAIQRLTETPNTAIQCHTETSNTAIQTPNNTVNQSSNSGGQSPVSDATLRRLAKKAGLSLGDFVARDGWVKEGKGNRAIWLRNPKD
jgi:hypothetical protein